VEPEKDTSGTRESTGLSNTFAPNFNNFESAHPFSFPLATAHTKPKTPLSGFLLAMTVDSVEFRKMQYTRELAAYTLRQWNLLRETLENKRSFAASADSSDAAISRTQPNSGTRTEDSTGTGTWVSLA
jgi:hypothetical protein